QHDALRPTRTPGRLARICPGGRETQSLGLFANPMSHSTPGLKQIFLEHIDTLALTLRPATVTGYRGAARHFLAYLHAAFPHLRRTGDLPANALLLTRATGIRIGECLDLALDCLRQVGENQWALHVPIGKLHSERLVPADADVRQMVAGILALRAQAPPAYLD